MFLNRPGLRDGFFMLILLRFMIRLSAVIITYNEEKNIGRCIDSLQNLADEILVVDSNSSDDTVRIATEKNARVILQPFLGYIEQKNFAMDQAVNDIVLSLDADECLSEELQRSLMTLKNQEKFGGAISMNRLTNYCGYWVKYGGWYPDTKVRLVDRTKARWIGVNPHDKLEPATGIQTQHVAGDLLHFSYTSISAHIDQINRFSEIGARALFAKGKRSNIFIIIVNPVARFIRNYILRRGFMDGFFGFVIAVNSSHAVFLKYVRLYLLQRERGSSA